MRISDWSSDVCSSDLEAEWSDDPNVPDEVHERIAAIDVEIGALVERPLTFDAQEMARAGVFVSIEDDGSLCIERGYVRPADEPVRWESGPGGEECVGRGRARVWQEG